MVINKHTLHTGWLLNPSLLQKKKKSATYKCLFSGCYLLCNAFPISHAYERWRRLRGEVWCVIRAALVLYTNSCRVLEDSLSHHRSGSLCCARKPDQSQSYSDCWPQQGLRHSTVDTHKVSTPCIFVSVCLRIFAHMRWIACICMWFWAQRRAFYTHLNRTEKYESRTIYFVIRQTTSTDKMTWIWYLQFFIHY